MKKIYFQREYVMLFYEQEKSLAGAVWTGFMSSDEFREAITKCLALIHECEIRLWLADNRGLKAIRQADQQWMVEEAVPQLVASSLTKMASLVPDDIFGQMALNNLYSRVGDQLHFENATCKNTQDALLWLLTEIPYTSIRQSGSLYSE
jgi:hypothetical protein